MIVPPLKPLNDSSFLHTKDSVRCLVGVSGWICCRSCHHCQGISQDSTCIGWINNSIIPKLTGRKVSIALPLKLFQDLFFVLIEVVIIVAAAAATTTTITTVVFIFFVRRTRSVDCSSSSAILCFTLLCDATSSYSLQYSCCLSPSHNSDFGIGPHEEESWIVRTATHTVVTGTEAVSDNHGDFRNSGTGYGIDQLGPVLGDPFVFVFWADHKACDIL
mmetsp:Transcript_33573/g.47705  ORF Transcript_33573/g.47705 Transcript_33573/m.47705 type:complete len:218 (-) Transcript_33573:211-864(-)